MSFGFYIKRVEVRGFDRPTVSLDLERGGNLITGASDTGKSYLFSVINFALGRTQVPKDIREASAYTDFLLEIRSFNNDIPYTLKRTITKRSVIEIKHCKLKTFETSQAELHKYKTTGKVSSESHIANFLLKLCGLEGKRLLTNANTGATVNLGVASLLKFTTASEYRIITEESPFYFSESVIKRIHDKSFIQLLISGKDYSEIQEIESKVVRESKLNAKLELISSQISNYAGRKDDLLSTIDLNVKKSDISEVLSKLQIRLNERMDEFKIESNLKSKLLIHVNEINQKMAYNVELNRRFEILKLQYKSDFERLEFIAESESLSSQLMSAICPICSSEIHEDSLKHVTEIANFRESVQAEMSKIQKKLIDLKESIVVLDSESTSLSTKAKVASESLKMIDAKLNEDLSPQLKEISEHMKLYSQSLEKYSRLDFLNEQFDELFNEQSRLNNQLSEKVESDKSDLLTYTQLAQIVKYVENRLTAWNFEENVHVNFDSSHSVFDIVISGKSRKSYGKGKRAISYSACLLGMLDYCYSNNMPFSNLIMLDSPLTTFQDAIGEVEDAEVTDLVVNSFFTDIASTPDDCQVIIFDNKIPTPEIGIKFNITSFTGNKDLGRAGFFNVSSEKSNGIS